MDRAAAEGRVGGRPPALSPEKAEAVRDFLENGGSVSAAARTFGVSRPTVRAVRDGFYAGQHEIIDLVGVQAVGTQGMAHMPNLRIRYQWNGNDPIIRM